MEEISSQADRVKVEKMIRHMQKAKAGEFDADLEKEFQAEFAEMQRRRSISGRLFAAIFAGIGLVCLVIAVVSAVGAVRQLGRELEAPGEVVDVVMRRTRNSETNELQEYYYPVVSFTPAGGAQMEVQLDEGSWPAAYGVGDPVTVLYDASRPRAARIKSGASTLLLWLLPLIMGVVGTVFAGVGVAVWRVKPQAPAWAAV